MFSTSPKMCETSDTCNCLMIGRAALPWTDAPLPGPFLECHWEAGRGGVRASRVEAVAGERVQQSRPSAGGSVTFLGSGGFYRVGYAILVSFFIKNLCFFFLLTKEQFSFKNH